ncbi:MAG: hypothetical protein HON53_20535 [Planctomycetaceae bacterium]|jgi:DNA-binding beta-propeller fold protein YncE|nr:hypothetical protein [Planctomycetaceae bacterium]MBT6153338.1 hypothetical protein [Planctomycetaceae bacterium]MBT6486262.1 hypothetical protein [Planctomycetaceae bacterium]
MTIVGSAACSFEPVPDWPQIPGDVEMLEAVGVAVDSRDRVYVFNRSNRPVLVFSADGEYLAGWGEGLFVRPHGIWIDKDDSLLLVDDMGHNVRRFSGDGDLLQTIGPSGEPSPTNIDGMDFRTISHGAPPYNMPTNIVADSDGDLFITDGYGNARVHHFSAAGEYVTSWGEPGDGPGQFNVPHGLGIDAEDRLYVADRENSRVQIMTREGELLETWTDVVRPCEVYVAADGLVFVAELGRRSGLFGWEQPDASSPGSRMSVFNTDGKLLTRWGGGDDPASPTDFYSLHDVQLDSVGNLYTAEVSASASLNATQPSTGCPTLRKFVRRAK